MPKAVITVLDGEGEEPYSRMAIPYLLAGQIGEEGVRIHRDPDHYKKNRHRTADAAGDRRSMADAHVVTLADGRRADL